MNLFESFRIAWTALVANKLRALLTMLGIIIGVSSVIGILAIGNGWGKYFESELGKFGVGVFYVFPGIDTDRADSRQSPQLTYADAQALLQPGAAPAVRAVSVEYGGNAVVSAGRERYSYQVKGVTPSYFDITTTELGPGRYFTANEDQQRARVALIGLNVAETLFGSVSAAANQRITINGVSFEVVGVLTTRPSSAGGPDSDPTRNIFIPYQTAVSRLFRSDVSTRVDVTQITVQAQDRQQVDDAIRQVTNMLRERHRLTYQDNDFTIINLEQISQQVNTIIGGFSAFLGIIAAIALLVGGIGVMNIMLVSVTERTREIGLRKAVGAKRGDILAQFLIEAVVLSLIGGAIGIMIGYGLSFVGTFVLRTVFAAEDASASVALWSVFLATGMAAAVGVLFGFFPALRASRLSPIQALRTE
jgi:putative ABC transport system permease protein